MLLVTAALLFHDNRFLLTRRLDDAPYPGYWEFPGGKVEADEDPMRCVERELMEELGITVRAEGVFDVLFHRYPERTVLVLVYRCSWLAGDIRDLQVAYGGIQALKGVSLKVRKGEFVSIVGPSNLLTLLETIPPYWESARVIFQKRLGDPTTAEGRAKLERQSPLNSAQKIKTPLLVAQVSIQFLLRRHSRGPRQPCPSRARSSRCRTARPRSVPHRGRSARCV